MKTIEVMEKYLRGKRLKVKTVSRVRNVLESMAEYSEDWPISGVLVNEYLASLTKYADTTVRLHFKIGKMVARYMKRAYKIENVFEDADVPKVAKKKRRYYKVDELIRILASCKFGDEREIVFTLIDSSCRVGGLAGLKGRDVKDGFIEVIEKTGERRYRLDARLCTVLKRLAGNDESYVFYKECLNMDSRIHRMSDCVRRVVKRAGMTGAKLGPHTLRHSSASLVAGKTLSPMVVKALLQHDDIDSTMDYIHDAEEGLAQAISPLEIISESVRNGNVKIEARQISMGEEVEVVEGEGNTALVKVGHEVRVDDESSDIYEDMFPDVGEDITVRPLLKTDDLRFLRRALINYARQGEISADMGKGRLLMKRILRKVGV